LDKLYKIINTYECLECKKRYTIFKNFEKHSLKHIDERKLVQKEYELINSGKYDGLWVSHSRWGRYYRYNVGKTSYCLTPKIDVSNGLKISFNHYEYKLVPRLSKSFNRGFRNISIDDLMSGMEKIKLEDNVLVKQSLKERGIINDK
jgi:hypothetical protein